MRSLLVRTTVTFALHYLLRSNMCLFKSTTTFFRLLKAEPLNMPLPWIDTQLHAVEAKLKHDANSSKIDFITLFSQLA